MAELVRSHSMAVRHGGEWVDVTVEEYDDGTVTLVLTTEPPVLSVSATLDEADRRLLAAALRDALPS